MPRSDEPRVQRLLPLKPQEFHILLALSNGERHGYGLAADIRTRSGGRIRLEPANLYRRIRRLAAQGLVEEAGERPAADAEDERRRYYRLTPLGLTTLRAEALRLRELVEEVTARRLIPRRGDR